MSVFSSDDIDIFYDEFATAALYNGVFISVIFLKDYEVESLSEKYVSIRKSEVPVLKKGDALEINSVSYSVISFRPNDNGLEYKVLLSDEYE